MLRTTSLLLGLLTAAATALAATTETQSFTNLNRAIPDGDWAGLSDTRSVTSSVASLTGLQVKLRVNGEFNGDVYAYVHHLQPGRTNLCVLLNRAGRSTTNAAGYADAGFDVTFDDAAANGDIHVYRNVTQPPGGTPLTGTWQPDGRKVDPSVVTNESPRTALLAPFLGASGSGDWTLFVADVESGGTNQLAGWELVLQGPVAAPLTWSVPADITYGTPLSGAQLNATSTVAGVYSYSPPLGTVLSAGAGQSLSVTFTPADPANYTPVTTNVSINVLKQILLITANSTNKVYGQALAFAGTEFTSSGLVNNDAVTSVSLASAGAAATAAAAGSPYPIVPSNATGTGLANYTINYANGSLTVSARPLAITANSTNKVYGQALAFAGTEFTSSGLVNNDAVTSVSLASAGAAASATVAGSPYPIVPNNATGTGLANYTISYANGLLTVNKASTADALVSSHNPSLPGESVTFTFSASVVPPGAGTLDGTVTFRVDGAVAATAALSGGTAQFSTASLAVGTHSVVAEYAGSANIGGTSATLSPAQLVNTPPVAVADTINRWPTNDTKVSIATLLANDYDADGDTITFVSVSPTSANGAVLVETNGWIFYQPVPGFTNNDTFTYSITDGRSAPVTGTVSVVVTNDVVPSPNLTATDLGGGSYLVQGDGIPGKTYRIQYTLSLDTPVWVTLGSCTANDAGIFQYTDNTGGGQPRRFYRSIYP